MVTVFGIFDTLSALSDLAVLNTMRNTWIPLTESEIKEQTSVIMAR
jgi:hypothetical protein